MSIALRTKVLSASGLILALVTYVDYITGYEFLFYVFYFIPVALCGWFLGNWSSLAFALISGLCWFLVDGASGHHYAHEGIRYWNGFLCFVAFSAIGLILSRLRQARAEQEQARQELLKTLEQLKRSSEEVQKLQSELQVVCAWTNRIRVNDEWISIEKFLSDKLHLSISHGISPEAFEKLKESLNKEQTS